MKRFILFSVGLLLAFTGFGQMDTVNLGTGGHYTGQHIKASTEKGDNLKQALTKVNNNFIELYVKDTVIDDEISDVEQGIVDVNAAVEAVRVQEFPIFSFTIGGDLATDTTALVGGVIVGSFYNSGPDTLVITALNAVMAHGIGVDTASVQVLWDVNMLDGTPTLPNTLPFPLTSTTTGNEDTAFANDEIPPASWVWVRIPTVVPVRKPTMISGTITGYRK